MRYTIYIIQSSAYVVYTKPTYSIATFVNYQHHLPLARIWGDGSTSSSDGMRVGRIEKTIFLLKYYTDTKLRREILIGLNKGEAMNGLARALFFGKSGNLREKDLQDQMQRASCLNILLNIVVIPHISPLNWTHAQLYGRYFFKPESSLKDNQFRDLRTLTEDEEGQLLNET